jgi:hypothetical protein
MVNKALCEGLVFMPDIISGEWMLMKFLLSLVSDHTRGLDWLLDLMDACNP